MDEKELNIIDSVVGEMSQEQLFGLKENLEYYIHPDISIFIPVYKHCQYAVSPDHSHPGYSFIYLIKSLGYFVVNGKKIPIPKQSKDLVCAFSPNVVHHEIVEAGFSNYIAVFVSKHFFDRIFNGYSNQTPQFFGNFIQANDGLLYILKLLMFEHSKNDNNSKEIIDSLNNIVVNMIIRLFLNKESGSLSVFSHKTVDSAILYMYENLERKISVDNIAEHVNTSSSHFAKIFKEITNQTPIEYLTNIRIEKAKRMLKYSESNLTEIAFSCGFTTSSYFSHCFIENVKLTPSEYKKRFTGKE